jgi:hypothetical protein
MRLLTVTAAFLLLVSGARAEEYQGRVIKAEKGTLTLAVTWRGDKGLPVILLCAGGTTC